MNDEPRWLIVIVVGVDGQEQMDDEPRWLIIIVVGGGGKVVVGGEVVVSGVMWWWLSVAVMVMWQDGGVMVAIWLS